MAEEHKYSIVVDFKQGDGNGKSPVAKKQKEVVEDETSFLDYMKQYAQPLKQVVRQSFDWGVSVVGRDTGCNDVQQKVDLALSMTSQAISLGTAIASGNYVGAMGMVATSIFSMAQEVENTEYEKNWERIGINLKYERAGASFNRSRM